MEEVLLKIREFADQAHGDQTRKYTPERYIVHPVRVMETCKKYTQDITMLAAALLHDVLEDTPVSKEQIRQFLLALMTPQQADRTVQLVVELSDVYVKKSYPHLNRRNRKSKELERLIKTSADSQTIKYADIIDNSMEIAEQDPEFAMVYLKECRTLLKHLNKGNAALHGEAMRIVDTTISTL